MKYIIALLLIFGTQLDAGRIGWEWSLYVDGVYRSNHRDRDACEARKYLYYRDRADAICKKVR